MLPRIAGQHKKRRHQKVTQTIGIFPLECVTFLIHQLITDTIFTLLSCTL